MTCEPASPERLAALCRDCRTGAEPVHVVRDGERFVGFYCGEHCVACQAAFAEKQSAGEQMELGTNTEK